jgi:hypothetical protein
VDLNLTTIPTAVDPDAFHSHHHYDVGIPIKTRFVRHPDVPIHEHNMKTMEDSYNLVANQVEQRKKHRGVSKQSPFNYQEAVTKEIMRDSLEFSKERNPLSVDPKS